MYGVKRERDGGNYRHKKWGMKVMDGESCKVIVRGT